MSNVKISGKIGRIFKVLLGGVRMGKVNLDALIPREDFEVEENQIPGKKRKQSQLKI